MIKPDYNNSILNLINTIIYLGGGKNNYSLFDEYKKYKDKKNIILFVIDGLGFHYLQKHGKNSFLADKLSRKITSVFPSTTASAITTYVSGLPPEKHGLTGWFMYLKELGSVALTLPFCPRYNWEPYSKYGVKIEDVYDFTNVASQIKRKSYAVVAEKLRVSDYTRFLAKSAESLGYENLDDYFKLTQQALSDNEKPKFIYSYWSLLDKLCHINGTDHEEVHKHFNDIDRGFEKFFGSMPEDTVCFISADHGLLDCREESKMHIAEFPEIRDTLVLPLCGEARHPYCYVNPGDTEKFHSLAKDKLGDICEVVSAEDMIEQKFFGFGHPADKFRRRIGHFNLLMKEDYALFDNVLGESPVRFPGLHGGTSKEEMEVPLCVMEK
ncbi:MAG: hypothetical protein CSB55_04825 [Candidatus Cloacimonadota bacterium]|nr:MAG: hypothetical protein CSB55_04825 [Candidatus Cloacimonadota bacterium]